MSELGFGCSSFWAKPAFPESQALALIEQAIDGGITFFDTGPSYAAGNAERRLGAVLRARGGAGDLTICSKAGTHFDESGRLFRDWSPEAVKTSVRRSLERLGLDRLQVLHLHGPAISDLTPSFLEALAGLKDEGLVQFVGINSFDDDVVRFGLTLPLFDSFMVEYNVLRKRNASLLADIASSGAGAIIGTPVAQALFRPAASIWPLNKKTLWELARAVTRRRGDLRAARSYKFLNEVPGMTGAQAALAYVLRQKTFATAVFGTTSAQHLALNLEAAQITLPPDVVRRIEAAPDS
ncbi:aldo/keto reductase [Methylocapsa palsarum]|uniref:Predicted oxidoreductase n=1 Tax=Methylocapsa palsarum TaxID=1612308 RepID=A0A1I4B1W0_9HYPH|nr:aldo/keto reductase [Methylocapsa palsarum]SFK62350.1 Predicted oxidoreductase [Methylocapsa palsarum]